jgi:phosphocarrier protein
VDVEDFNMNQRFYITSEYGLHARPATKLVNLAMKFDCDVHLTWQDKTVNLKSIMGLMSLGIYHGQEIDITTDGKDQVEAMKRIVDFIISEHIGNIV